jgi:hypothetical protein
MFYLLKRNAFLCLLPFFTRVIVGAQSGEVGLKGTDF